MNNYNAPLWLAQVQSKPPCISMSAAPICVGTILCTCHCTNTNPERAADLISAAMMLLPSLHTTCVCVCCHCSLATDITGTGSNVAVRQRNNSVATGMTKKAYHFAFCLLCLKFAKVHAIVEIHQRIKRGDLISCRASCLCRHGSF